MSYWRLLHGRWLRLWLRLNGVRIHRMPDGRWVAHPDDLRRAFPRWRFLSEAQRRIRDGAS